MSYSKPLTTLALAAALTAGGSTIATAEILCTRTSLVSLGVEFQQGYSGKPAKKINPGTSRVQNTQGFQSETCFDITTGETVSEGSRRTASSNYTDGPGNSPLQKRNPISSSCEATGTLSCP